MTDTSSCYMCESIAISREHVPAASFFPESKEIGRNLRRNLMTVPSCDSHNSDKSGDDEFLRAFITMTAGNNKVGRHQFICKVLPAAARRRNTYRNFFENRGAFAKGKGQLIGIDRKRFDRCIDHLARAMFFYTYNRKWLLPVTVFSPNLYSGIDSDQVVLHQPTMDAIGSFQRLLNNEPIRGENPDVFKYRIGYKDVRYDEVDEIYTFAAIFYDRFEVFTFSAKVPTKASV